MKLIKKLFGGIDLTWKKLVIFAVIAGGYTALVAALPITQDTSFRDISVTFEVWILIGTIIIMNSKSNLDAALKCFVFFLISKSLVYLLQVPFSSMGWGLFGYYRYWFIWTILTLPIGFIGYFLKKEKLWGLLILLPVLIALAVHAMGFFSQMIFWPPRHVLSLIGCLFTMYAAVLGVFQKNKKARRIGLIIDVILTAAIIIIGLASPHVYKTVLLSSGGDREVVFDDSWTATLTNPKYGDLTLRYDEGLEDYLIEAEFHHAGETELVLESEDGEKRTFLVTIEPSRCNLEEIEG